MWGTFRIEAWFKGDIIFEQEFEFPEQLPDNKLLSITNIWISDYTGEQVSPNATFDVDESLIIEAVGEWDQDPPENWIFGVIKTDGTNDSLLVPMGLVSGGYQDAFYRGIVGSGNLRQIYPDPENHFGYFDRDLMTVYAKQNGCDAPPNSMTDETYVSIIRIYVDEVDFENNHPLCQETGGEPPTQLIDEPQWIRNTKNQPACYTRNSQINMNLKLISNFSPLHNLNVYLNGYAPGFQTTLNTAPEQFHMYYSAHELQSVVSIDLLPNSINIVEFPYGWSANVSALMRPRFLNDSGPHKIYTTFQNPVNNPYSVPTNTLGLNLVCYEYAQGASEPHDILAKIMLGVYGESQIIYKPNEFHDQYEDPYDLYRNNHGQCNSFARFFLVLSHSVGVVADKATIYKGRYVHKEEVRDTVYYDTWFNTCVSPAVENALFLEGLLDPQGHDSGEHENQKCPPNWNFKYHVIGIYPVTITDTIGYDAVFNVSGNISSEYGNWFKFYFTNRWSHDEPPLEPPDYFKHPMGTNPVDIFWDAYMEPWCQWFFHPPLPGLYSLTENNTMVLNQNSIIDEYDINSQQDFWQSLSIVTISPFIDSVLGNVWRDDPRSSQLLLGRMKNIKYPGFYLNPPPMGSASDLTQSESEMLNELPDDLLWNHLHFDKYTDFILKYVNVLGDSSRNEFFGRTVVNDTKVSIGGWFGKFISIAVYEEFTDLDSFLEKAIISFKLPPLNRDNVRIHKKGNEVLYSLKDKENMFVLRGYNVKVNFWDKIFGPESPDGNRKVIELIKYYDKEFMR